jgi:hypothetical protein
MNAQPPPSLPDLPPNIFASLQVIERAIGESPMNRQRHIETEQALNAVAQFCVEAHKRSRAESAQEPLEVPASN